MLPGPVTAYSDLERESIMLLTKVVFCFLAIIGTSWFSGGGTSGFASAQAIPGYPTQQYYGQPSPCGYQSNAQNQPCLQQPGEQRVYTRESSGQFGSNQQFGRHYETSYQQVGLPSPYPQYGSQQSRGQGGFSSQTGAEQSGGFYQHSNGQFYPYYQADGLRYPNQQNWLVTHPTDQQRQTIIVIPPYSSTSSSQHPTENRFKGRPILNLLDKIHDFKMNLWYKLTGGQ